MPCIQIYHWRILICLIYNVRLRPDGGIMNTKILNSEMLLTARVSIYGLHACVKRGAGVETKHLLSISLSIKYHADHFIGIISLKPQDSSGDRHCNPHLTDQNPGPPLG